jgi:hypothetical protein
VGRATFAAQVILLIEEMEAQPPVGAFLIRVVCSHLVRSFSPKESGQVITKAQ